MPAEFKIINEWVCSIKYGEPLLVPDMDQSSAKLTAYADNVTHPLLVIGDYTDIKQLSPSLISVGIRQNKANPLLHPRIEKIVVVTNLALIIQLAAMASRILKIRKFVMVRTQADVDREIEAFLRIHNPG